MDKTIKWLLILLALVGGGVLAKSAIKINKCREIQSYQQIEQCGDSFLKWQGKIEKLNRVLNIKSWQQGLKILGEVESFWPARATLLGKNKPTYYLVLLQNDNELRANGGFFGSYAVIKVDQGVFDYSFEDIYVPDGQLQGHVEPPGPIQQAFKSGQWRLRDSDWDADFAVSAKQIRWFFEKGKEDRTDNIVTLPLSVIRQLLKISGPVMVEEYDREVTGDNLYLWLQNESEVDFFPGSTQKKDAINAAGKAVWQRFVSLPWSKKLQVANFLMGHLEKGNILVNSTSNSIQTLLIEKDWAGRLVDKTWREEMNWVSDIYLAVESNLGANKANCCVQRKTSHEISADEDKIYHKIRVDFNNQSIKENPKPPYFYGGNYIAYLRYFIPQQAMGVEVRAAPSTVERKEGYPLLLSLQEKDNYQVEEKYGLKRIGFFHTTAADSTSWVEISYQLYRNQADKYRLKILKQHGLLSSPQTIKIGKEKWETKLEEDYVLRTKI